MTELDAIAVEFPTEPPNGSVVITADADADALPWKRHGHVWFACDQWWQKVEGLSWRQLLAKHPKLRLVHVGC